MPDGIADRFVYEFKSTKELKRMKPVAERQADLYGYFFRRKFKRIQIRDVLRGKVLTFSSVIDRGWCLSIGRKAVASEIRESCAVELSSCY